MKKNPNNDKTVREAKMDHYDRLETGELFRCVVCNQHSKVYDRKIFSTMARHLIKAYRKNGTDWFMKNTTIKDQSGNWGKLALWGLIEEDLRRKEDGGRSGQWRVTELGAKFVLDRVRVPKTIRTYNAEIWEVILDPTVSIRDALGTEFNYNELMGR
jgi:hypothetical protein